MGLKEILAHYQTVIEQASGDKYKQSGIYQIFIDNNLVYIGRSQNMIERLASHMYNIDINTKTNKYIQLRRARDAGHKIRFDVLEYCSIDQIPFREAYWIGLKRPPLNMQIPKLDRPQEYWYNKKAKTIKYEEILRVNSLCS